MAVTTLAGLSCELVHPDLGNGTPVVVLLHGFEMGPLDLAPFARSMGLRARFVFPQGPLDLSTWGRRGYGWWPIDLERRDAALARGEPRDLADANPDGLAASRNQLGRLLDTIEAEWTPSRLVVGGFSQGAMLACDHILRSDRRIDGLVLLSGARIASQQWQPLLPTRRGLRVFQSHGRSDLHLSFEAAERFARDLGEAGWRVTWVPFDGGHEIPLPVLRQLKRFLGDLIRSPEATG